MMNSLARSLATVTSVALLLGFNAQAEQKAPVKHEIQRYTFTYNFNKSVSPVTKRTLEQQQYINYELMLDILASANYTISTITDHLAFTDDTVQAYNAIFPNTYSK